VRYDVDAPAGSRIRALTLADGSALSDDAVYTIAVNDFLAGGEGDGFRVFADAQRRDATEVADLVAFIDYIAALPQPFRAPAAPRFIPINSND
jgi:5'-nucleotidase